MTIAAREIGRLKMSVIWERYHPIFWGLIGGALWLAFGGKIAFYSECHKWHFDQLYSAFFGLASITTGFLATFYGTIQSMSAGFISRIRDTRALSGFIRFTKHAIIMGFFATIATIPMLIVQPAPIERFSFWGIVVASWFGVAIWALAGFWRVVSSLFILFEADGKEIVVLATSRE